MKKTYMQSFGDVVLSERNIQYFIYLFSVLLVLSSIVSLFPAYFPSGYKLGMADMFINYQGGFIRRGLSGELLLWLHKNWGLHPFVLLDSICIISALYLIIWFFKRFKTNNYDVLILLSSMCLGSIGIYYFPYMKRLYLLCIVLMTLDFIRLSRFRYAWIYFANCYGTFLLLTYEPAFFIFVPLFIVIARVHNNLSWFKSCLIFSPLTFTFCLSLKYSGGVEAMSTILKSVEEYNLNPHLLSFIGFTSKDLFRMHFDIQYLSAPLGIPSVIVNIFVLLFTLYVSANALSVMGKTKLSEEKRNALFRLLLFQMLMQSPMLIILSTDYGRICFFIVMSSFACLVGLSEKTFLSLFPVWYCSISDKLLQKLNSLIVPTRNKIILMILFLGVPTWQGHIGKVFAFSEFGSVFKILYDFYTYFVV